MMFGGNIKGTFVAAIVLLSVLVAAGAGWSVYSYLEEDATAQLRQRARTVGRMLAFNVRAGIEFDDNEQVWSALDATKDNPEITLVKVVNRQGGTIATYAATGASGGGRGGKAAPVPSSGPGLILEELPIEGLVTSGKIGTVIVGASDQVVRDFRQRSAGIFAGATLALALMSSAISIFFAGQFMKRKSAEHTLGGLARAVPGQAFVLSRDGRFVTVFGSDDHSLIPAAATGELEKKHLTDVMSPPEVLPVLEAIRKVIDTREPARIDFKVIRDGEPKWFEARVSPLESDSQGGQVILVIYDITEQRRLADQLAQVQRLDAMGQLVGGIAHDFNNILNVIVSHGELLRIGMDGGDPRMIDVNGILSATQRASQVTHRLLAFARKEVVQVQDLDIGEVVRRMQPLLVRAVGERITLKLLVGDNLRPVKAAVTQLEQALLNLVVNARDAIRDSGTIVIEVFNAMRQPGGGQLPGESRPCVMLAVSDTGAGIPPEIRERIFEPFFTTKGVGKGTGLGLSSVHGIVKQNGGHIEVYSETGQGTTFKLYFPAEQGRAEPLKPLTGRPAVLPRGDETVLLVEDDLQLRNVNARLLMTLGYTVIEADDGADGIHLVERFGGPIDIVVTDVVMPKMTGPELVARLRSLRPQAHVLYISGYTDNVVLYHGVRHEGVHFLHKPFTAEMLALKLRSILDEPKLHLIKS